MAHTQPTSVLLRQDASLHSLFPIYPYASSCKSPLLLTNTFSRSPASPASGGLSHVDGSQHIQGIILHCSLYLILFPTFYVPYR